MRTIFLTLGALAGSALMAAETSAPSPAAVAAAARLAEWVEPDFPFFSSVLDGRKIGPGWPADNLTPRGIILNLGQGCWACFDADLLRISAVWRGAGVSPRALAPGSYHDVGRKTPGGQTNLPTLVGECWLANGIYPGWQTGSAFSPQDPREPTPSPEEVGRGPLPEASGRLQAVRLGASGVVLDYTAGDATVREWMTAVVRNGQPVVLRSVEVSPAEKPLIWVVGATVGAKVALIADPAQEPVEMGRDSSVWTVRIPAHRTTLRLAVALSPGAEPVAAADARALARGGKFAPPPLRWPQEVTTTLRRSTSKEAYVVDAVGLPVDNPWRRGVRPGDIQFLPDGTGVVVTLDGDVWLARGLAAEEGPVRWRRFASGMHEPMTAAIRDGEIFVFDKNGIWRLRDTDGNGEADVHELFSNAFAQTADMREFPSQIRLAPKGEFVIAKGGQQATTLGKHNGSVLRISADGRRATVLGYGFRQPNLGVNLRTGLVTASDQQGQYIPSTPLHIVRDHQFYGFLAPFLPKEVYPEPPAEPLTWIPHPVNTSALSQVWMFGAQWGPLNDALVHIGFNRPELFRVLLNERTARLQAAVVSITQAFDYTPLNGSVNPVDGQLYIAGFQVLGWGNVLDTAAGLGRVRFTGAPVTLPREVVPMNEGVLLRFEVPVDRAKATDPASYSLQSWSYRRTSKYGSAQYKADGEPGQDSLTPSSAYVSADGRGVFVGVPGMKPVMQLRIGWSLATQAGQAFNEAAYTTPYELVAFRPREEGFGDIQVDLTPRVAVAQAAGPVTIEEGRRLAQLFACVACHADEQSTAVARSGPPWKGLFGRERAVFVNGHPETVQVDEAYLRESILNPSAKVAAGFEKGEYAMPSFAGVLNDSQVSALVLYLRSLR